MMAEIKIQNKFAFNVHQHSTFHHKVVEISDIHRSTSASVYAKSSQKKSASLTESKCESLPREVGGSVSFKGIRVVFLPPHDIITKVGWLVCNGTISTGGPYYATVV